MTLLWLAGGSMVEFGPAGSSSDRAQLWLRLAAAVSNVDLLQGVCLQHAALACMVCSHDKLAVG